MERIEYERLAAVEERAWWFHGLHTNLVDAWRRAAQDNDGRILDAGCGTGGLLTRLTRAFPAAQPYGLELDQIAAATARTKSSAAVTTGSITQPPFAVASLDAIFSADVLCHRGVEPASTLDALAPCLKSGGVLILNLPAYRWLFSGHDRAVDNVRRFGRGETRDLLAKAGFTRIRICYWNSFLFPLMVLQRLIHRASSSDVALLPAPVERLFRTIVEWEARLGRCGLRLPFGGSILAIAVKP